MTRFAKEPAECRRASISRHFDLDVPDAPCGACDACADGAAWRGEHFAARSAAAVAGPAGPDDDAPFRRGDWVRVRGRHLGQVVRVEGEGRSLRLVVESVSDLRHRTVDPRRDRVERFEPS